MGQNYFENSLYIPTEPLQPCDFRGIAVVEFVAGKTGFGKEDLGIAEIVLGLCFNFFDTRPGTRKELDLTMSIFKNWIWIVVFD